MNAFAGMVAALFADGNMAVDATITPAGGGAAIACRVLRKAPDEVRDFGGGVSIASETARFEVRASEVPQPSAGDEIAVGAVRYIVQGPPLRDDLGLVWVLDTYPKP